MHVLMVMVGGLVLLGVFILFGWLWGASTAGMVLAAKLFIPAWLVVAGVNMWVGVAHAGYSARDEFLILLLVFAVPAAMAGITVWRLSQS
jgi:hypothetical protein